MKELNDDKRPTSQGSDEDAVLVKSGGPGEAVPAAAKGKGKKGKK
jgi:hypothetical protein